MSSPLLLSRKIKEERYSDEHKEPLYAVWDERQLRLLGDNSDLRMNAQAL